MANQRDYTIEAAERALRLLEVFDGAKRSMTFSQIQQATGYSKSTVVRILFTLVKNSYLVFNDADMTYGLGPVILRLGHVAQISVNVIKVALPYLRALSNQYGLICYIGKRDRDHVMVLEKSYPSSLPGWAALMTAEGSDMPLYSTGIGKLFLAEMSDEELSQYLERASLRSITDATITEPAMLLETIRGVRKTHVAFNNAENERFIQSICVPVYDSRGQMLAGISVCGFSELLEEIGRDVLERRVRSIGEEISALMGYRGAESLTPDHS